jgi:CobQ-like glutamine amidotransferase family enzyme
VPEVQPTLRVCALYPDLMNIYADRGNLIMLERRCQWRGIGFALSSAGLGEPLDPDGADLYYMGGGQDRDQRLCAHDLAEHKRDDVHAAAARGAVILAVCGGYQLLGHSYELGAETLPGVGLVDLHTVRSDDARLIGNVAIEVALGTDGASGAAGAGGPHRAGGVGGGGGGGVRGGGGGAGASYSRRL